jgi:hypothetical protein
MLGIKANVFALRAPIMFRDASLTESESKNDVANKDHEKKE